MKAPWALLLFFAIFVFFPYGILLFQFSLPSSMDGPELWWALKNSFLQATLSMVGTLVMGWILCLGFFKIQRASIFRNWMGRGLEILLLLPSFLPPLFILLVMLSLLNPFPTGMTGVVLIHAVMNAGMVALLLKSLVDSKLKPLLDLVAVEGGSQIQFLRASWGMVARDIYGICLFVFVLCFCSFSIPLIAGGGRATTLEILIYEKIRISGAWSEGLMLSLLQVILILLLALLPFSSRKKLFGRTERVPLLGSELGVFFLGLYTILLMAYFVLESVAGWEQVLAIPGLWERALELVPASLMFALSVGLISALLLLLTAWGSSSTFLHRLLSGTISPSTALLGLALLLVLPNEEPWNWLKWIFGFSYLIFSTLYRWGWDQEVSGLQDQVLVAQTLGASRSLIFWQILFPQLLRPVSRVASVASLWALGDFALGKILMARDASLSLLIETLMSSYRLQAALALMGLLLLLGGLCFLVFWGLSHVCRRAVEQTL